MYLSCFVIDKAMSYKVFVVVLVLMLGVALLFAYLEHTYDNTKQRLRIPSVVLVNAPEKIFYNMNVIYYGTYQNEPNSNISCASTNSYACTPT